MHAAISAVFNLLFRRWREAFHRVFHYLNLLNMCSKQAFCFLNLLNVRFFTASQISSNLYILGRSPKTSQFLELFLSLKIVLIHTPLRASTEIALLTIGTFPPFYILFKPTIKHSSMSLLSLHVNLIKFNHQTSRDYLKDFYEDMQLPSLHCHYV